MQTEQGNPRDAARNLGRFAALLTLVAAVVVAAFGQEHARAAKPAANDDIVRGTVVSASSAAIEVRDAQGVLRRVAIGPTTLILSDDEEFSAANLPDIQLAVTDLSKGDSVEVVVEPNRSRAVAGIVTRLSPIEPTATARTEPHR